MREYELDELKWLLLKATRGPWQIVITRNVRDATSFMIREHSHPSVCVEADLFWPEDYEPLTDDDGYCQPDGHMDASPHHSANAALIVSAVNALPALLAEVEALRAALSAEPVDDRIGKWLSAALEDPTTCAEMRADIEAWFAARAAKET
jgi:hypothetical protein